MTVALDVRISGAEGLARDLDRMSLTSPEFKQGMRKAAQVVERAVQKNLRGGNPLHVRSGRLSQSVAARVIRKRKAYEGVVGPQRVVYARIHELGGVIRAKNTRTVSYTTKKGRRVSYQAQGLAFQIGDRWISKAAVTIPKRPYLKPAARTKADAVARILGRAFAQPATRDGGPTSSSIFRRTDPGRLPL